LIAYICCHPQNLALNPADEIAEKATEQDFQNSAINWKIIPVPGVVQRGSTVSLLQP
jgi:hypothetical protein